VRTALARASLLALFLIAVAPTSHADQPDGKAGDKPRPSFTAFPDLKPHPFGRDADVLLPVLPELPTDAPLLRKVLHAQAREGLLFLGWMSKYIQLGIWNYQFLYDAVLMADEAYTVAAEAESRLADRIPWYEERVRKLKELERFIETRVQSDKEPPHRLNFVRFHRLQAELDLLTLKDAVAKAGGGTPRPLTMKKVERDFTGPIEGKALIVYLATKDGKPLYPLTFAADTAFPDLKARADEKKTVVKPDGTTEVVEKNVVPLPRLPVLSADASVLRKVRREQVLEGFGYLRTSMPVMPRSLDGQLPAFQFLRYFRNTADTYLTAAELEERPADRIPWYEARVRLLKLAEQLVILKVLNGTDLPYKLYSVRFYRFQTEADLLRLKAEVERSGPATIPPPVREETVIEERWNSYPLKPRPYYTAVPDLKPHETEIVAGKDAMPLPPLPPVRADDPPARKLRFKQAQEGLAGLERLRQITLRGERNSDYFIEYLLMAGEVYPAVAQLEATPAKRIPWYEARVRTLKDIEQLRDYANYLHDIRIQRLRAEAELLALRAQAEAPPAVVPSPPPVCCCPPPCARPRGGVFARLLHRR
jgi:hypothetical protein